MSHVTSAELPPPSTIGISHELRTLRSRQDRTDPFDSLEVALAESNVMLAGLARLAGDTRLASGVMGHLACEAALAHGGSDALSTAYKKPLAKGEVVAGIEFRTASNVTATPAHRASGSSSEAQWTLRGRSGALTSGAETQVALITVIRNGQRFAAIADTRQDGCRVATISGSHEHRHEIVFDSYTASANEFILTKADSAWYQSLIWSMSAAIWLGAHDSLTERMRTAAGTSIGSQGSRFAFVDATTRSHLGRGLVERAQADNDEERLVRAAMALLFLSDALHRTLDELRHMAAATAAKLHALEVQYSDGLLSLGGRHVWERVIAAAELLPNTERRN